jgi:hypothetical protein
MNTNLERPTMRHHAWQGDRPASRPRELTHDEKKAAEAAFRGASFNLAWSDAARRVYDGIALAMARLGKDGIADLAEDLQQDWTEGRRTA